MAPLLVAVFDDETGACGGRGVLRDLHADGTLTLYAMATIARESKSAGLVIRQPLEPAAATIAPAVGAAIGALVTLLGGPITAATRSVTSGLVSAVWNWTRPALTRPSSTASHGICRLAVVQSSLRQRRTGNGHSMPICWHMAAASSVIASPAPCLRSG